MPEIYSISQEGNITHHINVLQAEVEEKIKMLSELSYYRDRVFIIGNHIEFKRVVDNIRGEKTLIVADSLSYDSSKTR